MLLVESHIVKVRTLLMQKLHNLHLLLGLIKVHPPLLLQAIKTLSSVMIALSWLLVEVIGNGEVLDR